MQGRQALALLAPEPRIATRTLMQYPKYLEFRNGTLLIFSASEQHRALASLLGHSVVSAGCVSASAKPQGEFFGESASLGVAANRQLDWSSVAWFEGTRGRTPVLSTDPGLLQALGVAEPRPAELREHENILFPSAGIRAPESMLRFFLP